MSTMPGDTLVTQLYYTLQVVRLEHPRYSNTKVLSYSLVGAHFIVEPTGSGSNRHNSTQPRLAAAATINLDSSLITFEYDKKLDVE